MSDIQTFCDSNGDIVGYALAAHTATVDPVTCTPVFGLQANYYDTDWVSLGSSLPAGWELCCCGGGGGLVETITNIANTITGHKIADYTNENSVVVDINETVTSLSYNAGTNELTFTDETGAPTVVDLTALAVDINVASLTYNPVTGEIILTETDSTVHTIDIGPPVSQFDIVDGNLNTETVSGGDTVTFLGDGLLLESVVSPTNTVIFQPIGGAPGDVLTTDVGGNVVWAPAGGGVEAQLTDAFGFRPTEHTRSNRIVAQWLSGIGAVNGSNQIMIGDSTSSLDGDFTGVLSGRGNVQSNGWGSYSVIAGGDGNQIGASRYSFVGGGQINQIANSYIIGYNAIVAGYSNRYGGFGNYGDFGFIGGGRNNDISDSGAGTIGGGENNRISSNYGSIAGGRDVRVFYGGFGAGYNNFVRGDYSGSFGLNNTVQAPYSAVFGLNQNVLHADFTTAGGHIVAGGSHNVDAPSEGMFVFGSQHSSTSSRFGGIAGVTNQQTGYASFTFGEGSQTTADYSFNMGNLVNRVFANSSYSFATASVIAAGSTGSGIFATINSTINTGSRGSVILGGYQNGMLNAEYSLAQGWSSQCFGFNNIALGNAWAQGVGATAIGGRNDTGPVPGISPTATGNYSVALGCGSQATAPQSFAAAGGVTSGGTTSEVAFGGNMTSGVGFRGVAPVPAVTIPVAATTSFADVDTALNLLRAILIGQGLAQ